MEWISVKDRLPPEKTNVILFDGDEIFCGDFHYMDFPDGRREEYWGVQACDGQCYGWYQKNMISHWMPLPEKPNELD